MPAPRLKTTPDYGAQLRSSEQEIATGEMGCSGLRAPQKSCPPTTATGHFEPQAHSAATHFAAGWLRKLTQAGDDGGESLFIPPPARGLCAAGADAPTHRAAPARARRSARRRDRARA